MSEWEPSQAVMKAFDGACTQAQSTRGWNQYHGLRAAVAADPLLSAAKDMQEALIGLRDSIKKRNAHTEEPGWGEVLAALFIADEAVSKSRGEQ